MSNKYKTNNSPHLSEPSSKSYQIDSTLLSRSGQVDLQRERYGASSLVNVSAYSHSPFQQKSAYPEQNSSFGMMEDILRLASKKN